MHHLRGVVLAVCGTYIAACYSPTFRDCEVLCTSGTECPSGFECRSNVCRAAGATQSCGQILGDGGMTGDADPLADSDGDRIVNRDDNCPTVSNTDQANEDRDLTGDACDPCPIASDMEFPGADADLDGDGVGAGCDPFPDRNTERFVFFDGFNAEPAGTSYPSSSVQFQFANGVASVVPVGTNSTLANAFWSPPMLDVDRPYIISTRMRLTALQPNQMTAGAGVYDRVNNDGHGTGCVIGDTTMANPPTGVIAIEAFVSNDNAHDVETLVPELAIGSTYSLALLRLGNVPNWQCSEMTASAPAEAVSSSAVASPRIGLHVRDAGAEFEFIYVVDFVNQ